MSTPLISIIVPCYNQAQYLERALQSVLNQTYSNWECLIVNDGSIDNTDEIAQKWIIKDKRFRYYYQENSGVSSARNLGIKNAKGAFIQFLDSDDILAINKIELSISSAISNNSNVVITNFKTFSDSIEKAVEHHGFLNPDFLNFKGILHEWGYYFNIPIHCGFFSITFFQNFNFSNELKGNEDWIMWLYVFKKNPIVFFIDKPLVFYRSHRESVTKNDKVMSDSYIKAIDHIKTILNEEEYLDFLRYLVSKKEERIIKLQKKISIYQNTTTSKILKKINNNQAGRMTVKFFLRIIKKK